MSTDGEPLALDIVCSTDEAAFDMNDFLTDTTTPSSTDLLSDPPATEELVFAIPEWSISRQTRTSLEQHHNGLRIVAGEGLGLYEDLGGRAKSNEGEPLPSGPIKARRQAQNRAAQRAFRERKEKHIQELEALTVGMTKEIAILKKDRTRLEGLLSIARVELETLKSMPLQMKPCTTTGPQQDHIACTLDGQGGRQTIVLTIDLNIRGGPTWQTDQPKVEASTVAENKLSNSGNDGG